MKQILKQKRLASEREQKTKTQRLFSFVSDEQMRRCADEKQLERIPQCLLDAARGQDELLGEAVAENEQEGTQASCAWPPPLR